MCKYEIYGNCDEETKDQEYCIFHKPNKDEEEAREFYRKFLDKFKPKIEEIEVEEFGKIKRFIFGDVDCRGYVFPKIPKGFDFSFAYSVFEGYAWFDGATFKGVAYFEGKKEDLEYKFYRGLSFSNAELRKGVLIDIPSGGFKLPQAEACRVQRISYEREEER